MRDQHQRDARGEPFPQAIQAALLERGVADGEYLVDQQHRGIEERRRGEAQPHLHAARIELHRPVESIGQLREAHDVVEPRRDLAAAQPEQRSEEVDVLGAAQLGVQPGTDVDEGADSPTDLDPARVRVHDPGQEPQERRLARTVRPDDADRLARLGPQVDVAENPAPLRCFRPAPDGRQRREARAEQRFVAIGPEPFPDPLDDDVAVTRCRQTRLPVA